MIVNNSANINKTNNHLSTQLVDHKKKTTTYDMENQVLTWDRHKDVAGLNRLMGSQTPHTSG